MFPRRLPSPSTLLALAALVMATTGSAIAAKHYLITSTKQIKPSVLTQLKGKRGPRGLQGPQGLQGATGTAGAAGTNGTNGTNGSDGLGLTEDQTLPSGKTETGSYVLKLNNNADQGAVALPMRPKLPAEMDPAHVNTTTSGTPTTHCTGTATAPTAEPGYLCIYETSRANMTTLGIFKIDKSSGNGVGVHGASIYYSATAAGALVQAVWAVTAP